MKDYFLPGRVFRGALQNTDLVWGHPGEYATCGLLRCLCFGFLQLFLYFFAVFLGYKSEILIRKIVQLFLRGFVFSFEILIFPLLCLCRPNWFHTSYPKSGIRCAQLPEAVYVPTFFCAIGCPFVQVANHTCNHTHTRPAARTHTCAHMHVHTRIYILAPG